MAKTIADEYSICIVDGMNVAIILSILFKNKCIDICIIEEKNRPFFNKRTIGDRIIIDLILSELKIESLYIEKISNISLLNMHNFSDLQKIIKVRKQAEKLLKPLIVNKKSLKVYGSSTSTLMHFLPIKEENIVHIDHGTECLNRVLKQKINSNDNKIDKFIKKILKLYNYPNHNINGNGYTLSNCLNDYYKHIDYRQFFNKKIAALVNLLAEKYSCKEKQLILFLPITQFDYNIDRRTIGEETALINFEELYTEIFKTIKKKNTMNVEIIVKFHHNFYLQDDSVVYKELEFIKKIASDFGLSCLHISEDIKDTFFQLIPAELLVKYIPFKEVIMMGSTVGLNIANKDNDIHCVSYTEKLPGYEEEFMQVYKSVNPWVEHLSFNKGK